MVWVNQNQTLTQNIVVCQKLKWVRVIYVKHGDDRWAMQGTTLRYDSGSIPINHLML